MKKLWLAIVAILFSLCLFACNDPADPPADPPPPPPTPPAIYTVTIVNDNPARGSATGAGTYEEGTQVVLEATATQGYALLGWYEDNELLSNSTRYEFTLTGDVTITVKWRYAWSGIV